MSERTGRLEADIGALDPFDHGVAGAGARVLGWGTAVPAHRYSQSAIAEWISADRTPRDVRRIRAAFLRAGVSTRFSCLPDFRSGGAARLYASRTPPTTADRMDAFGREAPALAHEAAFRAILQADVAARRITHLFSVTCTGFAAPGFDCDLIESLGLSPDVRRIQFGFQGCAAGLAALRTAAEVVRGDPEARVLVVAVELSSLHFQSDFADEDLRGHALFADGAGAAVVGCGMPAALRNGNGTALGIGHEGGGTGECIEILEGRSRFVPGTRGAMSWRVSDRGFLMRLSPEVPAMLAEVLPQWIATSGVSADAPQVWAVHPGGPAILRQVEGSLGLRPDALAASREVLRTHGNMSSATIFFVFDEIFRRGERGVGLALAFGPGLTIEGLGFRRRPLETVL